MKIAAVAITGGLALLACGGLLEGNTPRPPDPVPPFVGPIPEPPPELGSVYVDVGACPHECCTYGQWTAMRSVVLYDAIGSSQPVATVGPGEEVAAETGEVHTTPQPIRVLVEHTLADASSPPKTVRPGDVVWGLTTLGEGFVTIWHDGAVYRDSALFRFEGNCAEPTTEGCWGEALAPLHGTWWVKVRKLDGSTGFTNEPDSFDGRGLGC